MLFILTICGTLLTNETALQFKIENTPNHIFKVFLKYEPLFEGQKNENQPTKRFLTRHEFAKSVRKNIAFYEVPIKIFCLQNYALMFEFHYGERRVVTDKYIINVPFILNNKNELVEMEGKKIEEIVEEEEPKNMEENFNYTKFYIGLIAFLLLGVLSACIIYYVKFLY